MEKPPETRNPAASFTDDILIEILSRLPVGSVCRFKCVSRSWLNLISDPCYREKLPQTLAGFFYSSLHNKDHHFTSITENGTPFIDPSFPYLPVSSSSDLQLLDSCDGLLLCFYILRGPPNSDGILSLHYAVCNPATEKWVMLPDVMVPDGEESYARLCFDRTVSWHFHVILHVVDCLGYLNRLQIYSSKTGSWNSV
ncbi:hypothetical protein QOZ80_5BG0446970 [Eleusine coracana subsp. coracana]|nr:hypothetical protein QOZ80_5BG0446970 [Eleusine coracana subsp. coracana]